MEFEMWNTALKTSSISICWSIGVQIYIKVIYRIDKIPYYRTKSNLLLQNPGSPFVSKISPWSILRCIDTTLIVIRGENKLEHYLVEMEYPVSPMFYSLKIFKWNYYWFPALFSWCWWKIWLDCWSWWLWFVTTRYLEFLFCSFLFQKLHNSSSIEPLLLEFQLGPVLLNLSITFYFLNSSIRVENSWTFFYW